MAKREKITPPEITEELLRGALAKYEEDQRIESMVRKAYHDPKTKKKFADVAKAIEKLSYYWDVLSPEEIEVFFAVVNPAHTEGANLLLGQTMPSEYGEMSLTHDMEAGMPKVGAKIRAAIAAYEDYLRDRKDYNGVKGDYAYKELLFLLMTQWEKQTGKPVTYTRNVYGKSSDITKWVTEYLGKLTAMGAIGLSLTSIESKIEEVYKVLLVRR